jgi:hypothetical protein
MCNVRSGVVRDENEMTFRYRGEPASDRGRDAPDLSGPIIPSPSVNETDLLPS